MSARGLTQPSYLHGHSVVSRASSVLMRLIIGRLLTFPQPLRDDVSKVQKECAIILMVLTIISPIPRGRG
jgi:hypothetical protein